MLAQPTPAASSPVHAAPDEVARRWQPQTNVTQSGEPVDVTATGSTELATRGPSNTGGLKAAARLDCEKQARAAQAEAGRASAPRKVRQKQALEARGEREARATAARTRVAATARERRHVSEQVPQVRQPHAGEAMGL